MRMERKPNENLKFLIVQASLIIITAILVVVCAIPFFHLISDAIGRKHLAASLDKSDMEVASLENQLAKLNAYRLMGRSDSATDEDVRKQLEELQRKLASAENENQQLKQQMAMVSTLLSLVNAQRSGNSPSDKSRQDPAQSQPAQSVAQSQPGQVSSQSPLPAATSEKGDASKSPEKIIDDIVTAGDRITSMGEKVVAFGDKMTIVLTKLIGTVASFLTGMAVLIRWARKRPGPKTQTS